MASTKVSKAEKPPPAIVSVAPPASDVAPGLKLLAVSASPSIVGRAGFPSPVPHVEVMLTIWAPESGGGTTHESEEAVTAITTHLHSQRQSENQTIQPGTRAPLHWWRRSSQAQWAALSKWVGSLKWWVAAKAAEIQGTLVTRLHGVMPTRTLASEGKSTPVPKTPVSSTFQSDEATRAEVTVAAVITGVRDSS